MELYNITPENAIAELPIYMTEDIKVYKPKEPKQKPKKNAPRHCIRFDGNEFKKKYGIVLILAALFTIYSIILSSCVRASTIREVRADFEAEYQAKIKAYETEQNTQKQADYFLTGQASLDASVNQAVDAVAPVIAKLSTDAQKATEVCCMLARVMNPAFPKTFEEVASQPQQWMFYDGTDNTCTEHDREIAEKIIRPFMESGILPNGLTANMVYAEWTPNDYVLRDEYYTTSTMHTFVYSN